MPTAITLLRAAGDPKKIANWLFLLQGLEGMRLDANLITFNSTISACERSGHWRKALELLMKVGNGCLGVDRIGFGVCVCVLDGFLLFSGMVFHVFLVVFVVAGLGIGFRICQRVVFRVFWMVLDGV